MFIAFYILLSKKNVCLQIKESNGRPIPKGKKKEVQAFSVHRSLLCLILCGTILTVFISKH